MLMWTELEEEEKKQKSFSEKDLEDGETVTATLGNLFKMRRRLLAY